MEIMIVLTSGMKVKLCAIEPAALVAFVVLQGIVSLCTGAVMVKMTVETAVMNISVHITIRLVLVTSSLVATVSDFFFWTCHRCMEIVPSLTTRPTNRLQLFKLRWITLSIG